MLRHKSETNTVRSWKLLVLLIMTVSAMNITTDYLYQWLSSRPTTERPGIISDGYLHEQFPLPSKQNDRLHPNTYQDLRHFPNDKPNSSAVVPASSGSGDLHTYSGRLQVSEFVLMKLWQTFQPPMIFARAIRLIRIEAPSSIEAGKPIRLRCLYELRGEKLQSLAWYKNGREFYRYQPFERRQPVLTFSLNGINVDMSRSRNSTVHLTNTTMETAGRYKCEATSTTFREAHQEVIIQVLEPQSSGVPHLDSTIWTIWPYLTAILTVIAMRPD